MTVVKSIIAAAALMMSVPATDLAPSPQYFECPDVKYVYIPCRAGLRYVDCVHPADLNMVDNVVKLSLGIARELEPRDARYGNNIREGLTPNDEDEGEGGEDGTMFSMIKGQMKKGDNEDAVLWSITSNEAEHYYELFFVYPHRTFITVMEQNRIALFARSHIVDERFGTRQDPASKRQVLVIRLLMAPYAIFRRSAVYVYEEPPIYYIPKPRLGLHNEGVGQKRSKSAAPIHKKHDSSSEDNSNSESDKKKKHKQGQKRERDSRDEDRGRSRKRHKKEESYLSSAMSVMSSLIPPMGATTKE